MKKNSVINVRTTVSLLLLLSLMWLGLPSLAAKAEAVNMPSSLSAEPLPKAAAPREKYALLVGIENYNRGSKDSKGKLLDDFDWWNLHTRGDLELIAAQLIDKFEFKPENIKILCDAPVVVKGQTIEPVKKVTHQLIVDTFRTFITAQVKDKDVVYFHFSGHGQQIPDDNGDVWDTEHKKIVVPANDELDGLDETIIPQDYVSQKDGSNNIRDDEIAVLLDELSRKNPANVTISLDSCFSGTATRGDLPPRGGPWKGKEVDKKFNAKTDENIADFAVQRGTRGDAGGGQNYVFLSAASPRQTAKEVYRGDSPNEKPYGAFSYALAAAMEKSDKNTTNRDLFDKVTDIITRSQRDQNPQIEGNQLDKIVMEDGALPPQRFVGVKISQGNPYLTAGKLQGITKGSKFNLCPQAAKECKDSARLALVEITNVNPTSATVKVEGDVAPEKFKDAARAFEVFHSYEDTLKVAVRENARGGGSSLASVFSNLGLAEKIPEVDKSWNVLIRPPEPEDEKYDVKDISGREMKINKDFRGLVLQRRDGFIITAVAEDEKMPAQIEEALNAEARWLIVKSLDENTNPELSMVELNMIPVIVQRDETSGETLSITDKKGGFMDRGGKIELQACTKNPDTGRCQPNTGDAVRLEIKNNGQKDVYVTVLNLTSDGKIGPAFPINNTENMIKAGQTYKIPYPFVIAPPFGQESFRAIVTEMPTDFTPLIDPTLLKRGAETERGKTAADTPLGKILKRAVTGKRGLETGSTPASWATTTKTYFIVPTVK